MATAHLHAAVVQRSKGGSAVGTAAYAARTRLYDQRTGQWHDYSEGRADVMFEGVFLPKGAPDELRDLGAFANALEANEDRKDGQTARKFVVALPVELTEQQRVWLLQDYGKENFTRKGLAYHAAIHRPHAHGDDRNFHAHITVSMRTLDETGFAKDKDVKSSRPQALAEWRTSWGKMTNRHLERHGHEARIDMRTLEAQGIDRMPQIHLGQNAAAAERKGIQTERGDRLREIVNDNERLRVVPKDQRRAVGKEFSPAVQQPQDWTAGKLFARDEITLPDASNENRPENIDRDAEAARSQDAIDSAAIAYAEAQRQQLRQSQTDTRTAYEGRGEAMAARHAATWTETAHRHAAELAEIVAMAPASYQPGTMAEAEEAATGSMSFLLGLFASWAESITRSVSGAKGQPQTRRTRGPDREKEQAAQRQAEQLREAHSRELEAMMHEQARERASYERRRAEMLFEQAGAMQSFEQDVADKSSLREAFDRHTERIEGTKAYQAEKAEQRAMRDGPGYDGPELG